MCQLCNIKPVYEFTNKRKLCKTCYSRWFQKKFLYVVRKYSMIKMEDKLFFQKSKFVRDVVLEYLLKMYSDINFLKTKTSNCKVVLSDSADVFSKKQINSLALTNSPKIEENLPVYKNTIRPLIFFLDKEIVLFAKLKSLNFNLTKEAFGEFDSVIDSLEEKHPEIKHAILNSFLEIYSS